MKFEIEGLTSKFNQNKRTKISNFKIKRFKSKFNSLLKLKFHLNHFWTILNLMLFHLRCVYHASLPHNVQKYMNNSGVIEN
jgi:hypothetical protein